MSIANLKKTSPLPWSVVPDEFDSDLQPCDIVDANGESIFHDAGYDPTDNSQGIDNRETARRIVACMNALRRWKTEDIELVDMMPHESAGRVPLSALNLPPEMIQDYIDSMNLEKEIDAALKAGLARTADALMRFSDRVKALRQND